MYTLLALSERPLHAYDLRIAAINISLGGLKLSHGHLYAVLNRLAEDGSGFLEAALQFELVHFVQKVSLAKSNCNSEKAKQGNGEYRMPGIE